MQWSAGTNSYSSSAHPKLRIRHVINTVGPDAPDRLLVPQRLTLDSIARAISITDSKFAVEVVAVSIPEDPTPLQWMTRGPELHRSLLDLGDFPGAPQLPLLADLLKGFDADGAWDLGIFTNLDIAVQPLFYDLVGGIADRGFDAFTINRRVVDSGPHGPELVWVSAQVGKPHPGFDCFAFTPSVLAKVDVSDVVVGAPFVGRAFVANLYLAAERYHSFTDLHATFHLGADEHWLDGTNAIIGHNFSAMSTIVKRLASEYGEERVMSAPPIRRFVERNSSELPLSRKRQHRTTGATNTRDAKHRPVPSALWRREPQRIVLIADPSQNSAGPLAEILGTAPEAWVLREPLPANTGTLTRRIGSEELASSYNDRRVRADAIRRALTTIPAGCTCIDPSPTFLTTYADVTFDSFENLQITVLVSRRRLVDLVTEALSSDWFVEPNGSWADIAFPPTARMSMFPVHPEEIESPADLAIGYHLDQLLRIRRLQAQHTRSRWLELDPERLTGSRTVRSLFSSLNLRTTPETWRQVASFSLKQERRAQQAGRRSDEQIDVSEALRSFEHRFSGRIASASLADEFTVDGQR